MNSREPTFLREVTDGIYWIGNCNETLVSDTPLHLHLGVFLLVGSERTMLVDTATPTFWPEVSQCIDRVLGSRPLDILFPTHPEVPHAAALPLLAARYPQAEIVADARDYHLFHPDLADRVIDRKPGDEIDLGDMQFVFLPALMKDLPNTLWGYERTRQVMFVSDGFSVSHVSDGVPAHEDPLHLPGECALFSSELAGGVDVQKASYILQAALTWSRFIAEDVLFRPILKLFEDYPTRIIAPAHGHVIDNVAEVFPIFQTVHQRAFSSAMQGHYAESGDSGHTIMRQGGKNAEPR